MGVAYSKEVVAEIATAQVRYAPAKDVVLRSYKHDGTRKAAHDPCIYRPTRMALPNQAKRLLAGGSRAFELESRPSAYHALGRETMRWLQRRAVTLHLRRASAVDQVLALLDSCDCVVTSVRTIAKADRVELTIVAPWTVVSMLPMSFIEDLIAIVFPESDEPASDPSDAA